MYIQRMEKDESSLVSCYHTFKEAAVIMRSLFRLLFLSLFFLSFFFPLNGHSFTLITLEEALQPEVPFLKECSSLEENGPHIKINAPKLDLPLLTPFVVDIAFETSRNKIIDYDSLRVKYLKFIPIDLTDRVKPYLNDNRLVLKDVKVPQGHHCLQVQIGYKSGEKTLMEILLNVIK